jgi:hypothetical protein
MAFIPVPNTVGLFLRHVSGGAIMGNQIWVLDEEAGIVSPRVQAITEAVNVWWTTVLRNQISQSVSLVAVEGRDFTVPDGEVFVAQNVPPVMGAVPSAVLPAHTTLALSLRSGLAGRSRRGRIYHVGLGEGDVTGDFVSQQRADGIKAAWDTLRTAVLAPMNCTHVIVSFVENGAPRATALRTPVTTTTHVDLRVDTQRRRLIGEGN